MSETTTVTVTATGVERVRGVRALIAIATATLEVDGVEVPIQGITVRQAADGTVSVVGPTWRHPASGRWLPALPLPPEIGVAIADAVLAACDEAFL